MELLNKYFEIQKEIYDYFGYVENWTVSPLEDCTNYYWILIDDSVYFADELSNFMDGSYYDAEIFGTSETRICRKSDYTMITVDTNCDGNRFLQIFNNAKEIKQDVDYIDDLDLDKLGTVTQLEE